MCVRTTDRYSQFTNTRLFIGQIRKCVCVRVLCVFVFACMKVRVEVNSLILKKQNINNYIFD